MNYVISGYMPSVWRSTFKFRFENKKEITTINGYFCVEDLKEEDKRYFIEQLFAEYCMEYGLFKEE